MRRTWPRRGAEPRKAVQLCGSVLWRLGAIEKSPDRPCPSWAVGRLVPRPQWGALNWVGRLKV